MDDERMGEQGGVARAQDGGRHLADAVREVDLAAEARSLRDEEAWQREGHSARTLVKNDSLRIVLIDMKAGARLHEHRTSSRISIQVLSGTVRLIIPGQDLELTAGRLVALDESIPHDVEAAEPSSFLLTIALQDGEAGAVH
jgi:quercetin dioxygenase-like cupin family protein